MAKMTYTAICFFPKELNKRPHKYKNVSTPGSLATYMKRKGAEYINFYCANTREYKFQFYLNPERLWQREKTDAAIRQFSSVNLSPGKINSLQTFTKDQPK